MRLIGLWNAKGIEGTSGGDECFKQLWKRFDCEKILITPNEKKQPWCFTYAYIVRTLQNLRLPEGEVVYASSDFFPDVIPAYLSGLPWVQKIYHVIPRWGLSKLAQKFSFYLIKKRASVVITDNKLLIQELRKLGFKNRIEVVYPGVIQKESSPTVLFDNQYDYVCLGRLHKSKGIKFLISFWKNVLAKNPKATLAIIGRGKPIKLKGVTNFGYVSEEEKDRIMRSSGTLLSFSKEEGFNMAMAEAISYGLPTISYSLPLYEELFNGVNKHNIHLKFNWDKSAKREMELICELVKK